MALRLTIGDFSRMTHLSVKALRHYHEVGLLVPRDIDRSTGYRLYDVSQVGTAQAIRRLRELDMPLDELREVLGSNNPEDRNTMIAAHLRRMERRLAETQSTVASLRALLERPHTAPISVEFRRVSPAHALAIREQVSVAEFVGWWERAFRELRASLKSSGAERVGHDAALYSGAFFEEEVGEVVAFIPIRGNAKGGVGVEMLEIPGAELAIALHEGAFEDLDQAYATLGAYVAQRAIGVEGPIREYYKVTPFETKKIDELRTEVGWPVFMTG
jgi:DNA-binding transcriptional MerR regulator